MTDISKTLISSGQNDPLSSGLSTGDSAAVPIETNLKAGADRRSRGDNSQPRATEEPGASAFERRKAKRFPLAFSATIRWLGNDNVLYETPGTVSDISVSGVFVEVATVLYINTNVELEITALPLIPNRPQPELHFEGRVVRGEYHGPRRGFAARGILSLVRPGGHPC